MSLMICLRWIIQMSNVCFFVVLKHFVKILCREFLTDQSSYFVSYFCLKRYWNRWNKFRLSLWIPLQYFFYIRSNQSTRVQTSYVKYSLTDVYVHISLIEFMLQQQTLTSIFFSSYRNYFSVYSIETDYTADL